MVSGWEFPEICQQTIVMTADTSRPDSYESQIPTEFDKHVILQYFWFIEAILCA